MDRNHKLLMFTLVLLDDSSDQPRMLTQALKNYQKILVRVSNILDIERREIVKQDANSAWLLILSHRFPDDIPFFDDAFW